MTRRFDRTRALLAAGAGALLLAADPATAQEPWIDTIPLPLAGGAEYRATVTWTPYHPMHGSGPVIVLLTEALISAPQQERAYQRGVTERVRQALISRGYSVLVLEPSVPTDTPARSREEGRAVLRAALHAALDSLQARALILAAAAVVGFGDGALVTLDWAVSQEAGHTPVAALAPRAAGRDSAYVAPLLAASRTSFLLLVIDSPCSGPLPGPLLARLGIMQRLLVLPSVNRWLARSSGSCDGLPSPGGFDYDVSLLVADWLARVVFFPQ